MTKAQILDLVKKIDNALANKWGFANIGQGSGFDITINRQDITKNITGLSDTEVTQLVEAKTAEISNATTAIQHPTLNTVTNYITIYNETAPITNDTIWKDPVEVPNPDTADFYSRFAVPFKDGYIVGGYRGISIYNIDADNNVIDTVDIVNNNRYGATITWDGKRIMSVYNTTFYMYEKQDDGSWVETNIGITESGNYGASMISWDGRKFLGLSGIYEVQPDGTWLKTGTYTGLNTYISFATPDLKFIYGYNWNANTTTIRFAELQADGTYNILPDLVIDTDNYEYLRPAYVTLDAKKLVCKIRRKADNKYVLHTYYRNADNTWSFICENTSANGLTSGSGGVLLSLDGTKVYSVGASSSSALQYFEQDIDALALDAYSTDPFGDGSLIHFYPFDNSGEDIVGSVDGVAAGTITYDTVKYNSGLTSDTDSYIDISPAIELDSGSISFWVSFDDLNTTAGGLYTMILGGDDVGSNKSYLWYNTNSQALRIATLTKNYSNDGEDIPCILEAGTLYHMVWIFNSTGFKVYIDGSLVGEASIVLDTFKLERVLGAFDTDYYTFKGTLDHLQIFNRALTEEEINKLYTAEDNNYATLDANKVAMLDDTFDNNDNNWTLSTGSTIDQGVLTLVEQDQGDGTYSTATAEVIAYGKAGDYTITATVDSDIYVTLKANGSGTSTLLNETTGSGVITVDDYFDSIEIYTADVDTHTANVQDIKVEYSTPYVIDEVFSPTIWRVADGNPSFDNGTISLGTNTSTGVNDIVSRAVQLYDIPYKITYYVDGVSADKPHLYLTYYDNSDTQEVYPESGTYTNEYSVTFTPLSNIISISLTRSVIDRVKIEKV